VTISQITGSTRGIVLTRAGYTNPVTVTATGTVSGGAGDGLYAATRWTIQNYGAVSSVAGAGVDLTLGGAITNALGGMIAGHDGIDIRGNSGRIENGGTVIGSRSGVYLAAGGTITNGDLTNSTALIKGSRANGVAATAAIIVEHGVGWIANAGTIANAAVYVAAVYVAGSFYTYTNTSILLEDGGTVTNTGTASEIANGVSIASAAGKVVNSGDIGSPIDKYYTPAYGFSKHSEPSIKMTAGGRVYNGEGNNISARVGHGVDISGGVGAVINNGHIGAPRTKIKSHCCPVN